MISRLFKYLKKAGSSSISPLSNFSLSNIFVKYTDIYKKSPNIIKGSLYPPIL